MLTPPIHHISHADCERNLEYYRIAQPLMLRHFGGTPMVYAAYPRGLDNYAVYHGALHAKRPATCERSMCSRTPACAPTPSSPGPR